MLCYVRTKLKELWPKTMTLLQFQTASARCKESVYVDVSDAYQAHVDFVTTKWDSGIGTANLLLYDKAMRQKYTEHPELGFPQDDQMLVFKHLITPNLLSRTYAQQEAPEPAAAGKRAANGAPKYPQKGNSGGSNGGGPSRGGKQPQAEEGCFHFGRHQGVTGCDGTCREDRKHFCLKCGVDYGKAVKSCPKNHRGNECVPKTTHNKWSK